MRHLGFTSVLDGYEQIVLAEAWEHDWDAAENDIVVEHLLLEIELRLPFSSTWVTRALFYWRSEGRPPYVVVEWDFGLGKQSLTRTVKAIEAELYMNTLTQLTAYSHLDRDFEKDFEELLKLNREHGGRASRAVVESYYTRDGGLIRRNNHEY